MSHLSGPEIAKIRARLDARSPGSWIACVYPTIDEPFAVIAGLPRVYRDKSEGLKPADARFIANAPGDIARLLAELAQSLQERIALYEALRAAIAYVKDLEEDVARLEDALLDVAP